jgi:cell division transport system permease protein
MSEKTTKNHTRYNIFYFIGEAFKGFFRNGVMSFASVIVLMSCLVVLGGFSLMVMNINANLNKIGMLNEIVVFAYPNATSDEILSLETDLKSIDDVTSVEHVTKQEALQQMKDEADDPTIYDDITDENNPLSDSFVLKYSNPDKVDNIQYQLKQISLIRKINNRADIAQTLSKFKSSIMLVFVWFLVLLFVVSLFVIINTIKIAVFSRRQEITVMRYVGATNAFIRLPFVFEGAIIGIFSAALAYFVEWYVYRYVEGMITDGLQMITILSFRSVHTIILVGFIVIGIFSGILGSLISIGKYLKK